MQQQGQVDCQPGEEDQHESKSQRHHGKLDASEWTSWSRNFSTDQPVLLERDDSAVSARTAERVFQTLDGEYPLPAAQR